MAKPDVMERCMAVLGLSVADQPRRSAEVPASAEDLGTTVIGRGG